MHKYNYTYKITNIKTKEFYVGVRSCDCEIKDDKYMGSSSIWTKLYIKEHKSDLQKEILEIFETRKLANSGEVLLLKSVKDNPLCILYSRYDWYKTNSRMDRKKKNVWRT